jgi:hypothetical protein
VHNDSGDSPRFFAVDRHGRTLAQIELPTVPILIDPEDIAVGPAPNGGWFVYLGDTGNNFARGGLGIPRKKAVLYRMLEPLLELLSLEKKLALSDVLPIVLTFPDGAHDTEAFFFDPSDGDLYMITKEDDGRSLVLGARAGELSTGAAELRHLGDLHFGQGALPGNGQPTAASITRDGRTILVRTYSTVFSFERRPGEAIMSALSRPPKRHAGPALQQGEAITFTNDGAAFITVSEGSGQALWCTALRDGGARE